MPGIHVHTLGRLHWENKDRELSIAVPGSYWLCHRNVIYKFTFKFHKTIRNTSGFTHSKELMKIIRKVIKWRPQQGQHFSTKNLLVTYNDASWTRQDKMVALMKFTERPDAAPFSHAFTLTVNFLHQDSIGTSQSEMGASTSKSKTDTPSESLANGNSIATHDPHNSEAQEELPNPLVSQLNENNAEEDRGISRSLRSRISSKESDSNQSAPSSPVSSDEIGRLQSHVKRAIIKNNGSIIRDRDKNYTNLSTSACPEQEVHSTKQANGNNGKNAMDCDSPNRTNISEDESGHNGPQSPRVPDLSPVHNDEDTNFESACLPYQYLIEKDIERELEISRNASRLEKSRLENDIECEPEISRNAPRLEESRLENDIECEPEISGDASRLEESRSENNITNSKNSNLDTNDCDSLYAKIRRCRSRSRQESMDDSMPPPDIANLRSSDITDLVMKGRMFTIRQEEDMVTVVEQKTKVELDEVLENSEKVETEEGDSCLLNSSLLRLEKMITRMQEPNISEQKYNGFTDNALLSFIDFSNEMNIDDEKRHEADTVDSVESKEIADGDDVIETTNCWTNFFTDRDFSNSTLENFKRILEDSESYINDENQDDDLELKLDDEDDDQVLPEGLMQFSCNGNGLNSRDESSKSLSCEDNLVGDKNKLDVPRKSQVSESDTDVNESDHNSVIAKTDVKDKSSTQPRMISNELISNHQIPSVLLKTLSEKKTVSRSDFGSNNNMMKNHGKRYTLNGCRNGSGKVNEIQARTKKSGRDKVEDESETVRQNSDHNSEFSSRRLRKRNIDRLTDSSSVNNLEVTVKLINTDENHRISREKNIIDSSNFSHHDSTVKLRRTRSNSNVRYKLNESHDRQNSHESPCTQKVETKTGDIIVKDSNESLLVNAFNDKQTVRQKRRKSVSQDVSKFCKTVSNNGFDKKDVSINLWKLLSDLENGVEVVIERMNATKIPR